MRPYKWCSPLSLERYRPVPDSHIWAPPLLIQSQQNCSEQLKEQLMNNLWDMVTKVSILGAKFPFSIWKACIWMLAKRTTTVCPPVIDSNKLMTGGDGHKYDFPKGVVNIPRLPSTERATFLPPEFNNNIAFGSLNAFNTFSRAPKQRVGRIVQQVYRIDSPIGFSDLSIQMSKSNVFANILWIPFQIWFWKWILRSTTRPILGSKSTVKYHNGISFGLTWLLIQ